MSDLKDFQFDAPKGRPGDFETGPIRGDREPTSPGKGRLLAILIAVIALAAGGFLLIRKLTFEAEAPVAAETEQAAPATATPPDPELRPAIDLPDLDASDEITRRLVQTLSAHPSLAAWLATDDLVRSFTAAVVNISEGTTPKAHLGILAPREPFTARSGPGGRHPTAKGYARYDAVTEVFTSIDTTGTVQLYEQLEPLIDNAFLELGYPGEEFRRVLIGALDHLLAAPNLESDVALEETVAAFEYADPELEALSAAQKQLLRMGPDNVRKVQRKIRDLRRELLGSPGE